MSKTNSIIARSLRFGLTALLLFVASVAANADDFSSGGLGYSILSFSDKTCEVCCYYSSCSGNVVIPETVKYLSTTYTVISIGSSALKGCTGLTEMTIPNTVTSIGDYAFYGCSGLNSISISNSVTEIGYYTFYGCSGLTGSLNIPDGVTSIGSHAFDGCSGLTEITIPNSVTEIGYYAFYKCSGLTGTLTIPDGVTIIDDYTFDGCSGLTSLTLGNSVTSIGRSAFCECTGLTGDLIIPNSVKTIGYMSFYQCTGLNSVTIGNGVTTIDGSAFSCCYGLTGTLTIPESVTSIGRSAFSNCSRLTEINIPEGVTEIGVYAFAYCEGLKKVNFNAIACTWAYYARNDTFHRCDNISTFNFGDNVTIIPEYLCYELTGLTEVTIPNSVKMIGYGAFNSCSGLTSVTIGESVTSIGDYAFSGCKGLTGELVIPNSVTSIGSYAFRGCTGLTSVTIGFRVTGIGNYAFSGTNPKEIYSKNPTPPYISALTFDGVDKNTCILYVPVDSQNKYSTADYWSEFFNIEGMTFDDVLIVQTYEATEVTTRSALLRGLVTVGDEDVLEQGFEYWTEGGDVQTATSPDLIMAVTLTGLEDGVTYMYRAYAKTASGTTYGDEMTFTTIAIYPPTVQTYEATEVTTISVLLRGVVTAGSEDVLVKGFEYWTEGGDVQTITSPDLIMAVTLTGLEDGVTYTYRAYATTESGTIYGEEMTFTTIKAPTVQTYEVTEITENSALLKGYVTAGNEDLLGQGFEYWAAGGEVQTIAMADQMMAVTITGLNEGTTYTCRAYAKTASGTTYGEEVTFTTLGTATITPPTVQTFAVTEVTESTAVLKGQVTAGSEDVLGQGFEYWAEGGEIQTIAMTKQSMETTLTGLEHGTTYSYRAYAITASGTTYGIELTFTTSYNMDGVYAELEEAIEEMYDDFKAAWKTITTDYPEAEEDCMEYYDDIFDKVMELTDLLDSSYRNGTLYDDVVEEIRSGIAEGERMIEEMLVAAKEVHETGIEDILANCGDDAQAYNLAGSRVHRFERGNVYIIRNADGTAKKVLVK